MNPSGSTPAAPMTHGESSGTTVDPARATAEAAETAATATDWYVPPEPIADCGGKLRAKGVDFTPVDLPVHERKGIQCGAPQVVRYRSGPEKIRWNVSPIVSCGLALALADFERIANEETRRAFGSPVRRIEQGGTYNCRKMARWDVVSEHSFANAIDVRSFLLANGRRIVVADHFGPLDREPQHAEGRFLRALSRRLYDDGVFSVVLTRFFDELHRDHFHLDMAHYRVDGTRPASEP
jgi:hypothetical protein